MAGRNTFAVPAVSQVHVNAIFGTALHDHLDHGRSMYAPTGSGDGNR